MTDTSHISDHLLPLTKEEQDLLDLYAKVKQFEREAAVAKAEAAKAKLDAANEEFQREQEGSTSPTEVVTNSEIKKKKKTKKRKRTDDTGGDDDYLRSDDEDNAELTDTDDEEKQTFRRNEAKIEKLRQERDIVAKQMEKEQASVKKEEQFRKELLESNQGAVDLSGPSLKKKRTNYDLERKSTSLISNMNPNTTPPHDFSKSLGMKSTNGIQLFPDKSKSSESPSDMFWSPPKDASYPEDRCLELDLQEFDGEKVANGEGNNTVAIKFSCPSDSKRFSINIAEPSHENYHSVLFHFNPRQFERGGQVVINDKQVGVWGQGINIPLSTLPLMFGEVSCTLIIQINGDGFDIFMNGQHCARLEHRTPLPQKAKKLILQCPSTDDYNNREDWSIYKIWWGHKPSMASADLINIPGVNSHISVHSKKLFVSGLPKIHSQPEIDLRRAELERAFRKYGGLQGVTVICPPNSTFAFVEVETERAADNALREMIDKYPRINRARRSRHEALLEQRAAKEAESNGIAKETSEWD